MEGGKQDCEVFQSTSMKNGPDRRVLAIRVLKVSQPNRHHSFPSTTRPTQIKSTNSIHIPIRSNDYPPSMPPTPCNTPSYSQRSPVMKKYVIIRKKQNDQTDIVDDHDDGHSPNLLNSPDILNNNELIKTKSLDTYSESIDSDLKNNSMKTRICHWISTNLCVILCIVVFILINGAICGAIIGMLFSRNLL